MLRPIRITCTISSLGGGGAERSLVNLATLLAEKGHEVRLLTLQRQVPDAYSVPSGIRRYYAEPAVAQSCQWINLPQQLRRNQALRRSLLATQPEIVISFVDTTNVAVLQAMMGTGIQIAVAERTDPQFHAIGLRWQVLRRLYYPLAAQIIVQGKELCNWAKRAWWPSRVCAIPNPIFPTARSQSPPQKRSDLFPQPHTAIAMGRLDPVKGFDRLIDAFAEIAPRFPDWHLTILGEGALRPQLEAQIEGLSLKHRISLPGRIDEPANVVGQADLFVLSSHYEGFPNAMLEAMACGLPAIALDTSSGPRAIVRHNVDGLLVSPAEKNALSKAMADLMADDVKRQRFATRAPEVLERFSPQRAISAWEAVIAASLGL